MPPVGLWYGGASADGGLYRDLGDVRGVLVELLESPRRDRKVHRDTVEAWSRRFEPSPHPSTVRLCTYVCLSSGCGCLA